MKKQIIRISPLQSAKVVAALYFVITIPFIICYAIATMFMPSGTGMGFGFAIFAPFLYAVVGFVFALVGAFVYNVVAGFIGGIEYTATEAS